MKGPARLQSGAWCSIVGGNHEASNYLAELPFGGWVAPNIYFLGNAGIVNFGGVRIGGLTGIYNQRHYRMVSLPCLQLGFGRGISPGKQHWHVQAMLSCSMSATAVSCHSVEASGKPPDDCSWLILSFSISVSLWRKDAVVSVLEPELTFVAHSPMHSQFCASFTFSIHDGHGVYKWHRAVAHSSTSSLFGVHLGSLPVWGASANADPPKCFKAHFWVHRATLRCRHTLRAP